MEGGRKPCGAGETGRPVDGSQSARRLTLSLRDIHFFIYIIISSLFKK